MNPLSSVFADFKTVPYQHQMYEFEQSCDLRRRALLWQMRTGKTKVTIDTAFWNNIQGRIDAVIIFAPNGVHENWIRRELPIHGWHDNIDVWAWRTDLKNDSVHQDAFEDALRGGRFPWFAFPSSGLSRDDMKKAILAVLKQYGPRILFIADESHDYRSPDSKRSAVARTVASKCLMRRILTGTVVENTPLAAWGQFELLKDAALGYKAYGEFEKRFAEMARMDLPTHQYNKIVGYRDLPELTRRMGQYSSVLLRSDCHDLPELVHHERKIPITNDQLSAYNDLKRSFLISLNSGIVSVGEQTQKLIKMQQVMSGFVRDEFGNDHDIMSDEKNPRLNALVDEVNLTGGRNIIWCAFKRDMQKVKGALERDGHEVLEYHGGTSASDKARARKEFEPGSHGVSHLVGHPVSGGSGLDLSAADKIIWYSHTFDAIIRSQADERATAIGGGNVSIVDFSGGLTDDYVRNNVRTKVSVAESVSRGGLKEFLAHAA